ncbi:MAG: glycosyltransferase [Bacteroides sp.]|nr:glycosyltransferase [Bacteroides sp.]
MKILLVTRGSQGDVYPYLTLASALIKRNHQVTISLPKEFEKLTETFGVNYVLQELDNIGELMTEAGEAKQKTRYLLQWMRRVIDIQFQQLTPLVEEHDPLIASNTEFAAVSIGEYCKKPVIRTAFGPFIPGKRIPPPAMPFPKPHPLFKPALLWKLLNISTNFMVKKTVNRNRIARGMAPIDNFGFHAVKNSYNFLLYSRHLGSTNPGWNCTWQIGGYCFNDDLPYQEEAYLEFIRFVEKDDRPTIFFTLGSCDDPGKERFSERLLSVVARYNYKLVVGSGWSRTGTHLQHTEHLYILTEAIPHALIFPYCTAVVHHGGCGTTHSVARAGVPQLIVPLLLDQPYWSYRVTQNGVGPEKISIKVREKELEKKLVDLVTNAEYKEKARMLAEKMKEEKGVENFCRYIEEQFSK